VAGPNGSGKSTLYGRTDIKDFGRSVWIINPDLLTAHIAKREKLNLQMANAATLDRIHAWLGASVKAYRTIGVETVLSTPKYRRLVRLAKRLGFEIRLLYVTLQNVELNIQRVKARVREGGHSVPVGKIRTRQKRSYNQLPWFLEQADIALIYDNSSTEPKLIGEKWQAEAVAVPSAQAAPEDEASEIYPDNRWPVDRVRPCRVHHDDGFAATLVLDRGGPWYRIRGPFRTGRLVLRTGLCGAGVQWRCSRVLARKEAIIARRALATLSQ